MTDFDKYKSLLDDIGLTHNRSATLATDLDINDYGIYYNGRRKIIIIGCDSKISPPVNIVFDFEGKYLYTRINKDNKQGYI